MKIQKVLSREYKGTKYHKYLLVLPEELISLSNLKEGDELKFKIVKGKIILEKSN